MNLRIIACGLQNGDFLGIPPPQVDPHRSELANRWKHRSLRPERKLFPDFSCPPTASKRTPLFRISKSRRNANGCGHRILPSHEPPRRPPPTRLGPAFFEISTQASPVPKNRMNGGQQPHDRGTTALPSRQARESCACRLVPTRRHHRNHVQYNRDPTRIRRRQSPPQIARRSETQK